MALLLLGNSNVITVTSGLKMTEEIARQKSCSFKWKKDVSFHGDNMPVFQTQNRKHLECYSCSADHQQFER